MKNVHYFKNQEPKKQRNQIGQKVERLTDLKINAMNFPKRLQFGEQTLHQLLSESII